MKAPREFIAKMACISEARFAMAVAEFAINDPVVDGDSLAFCIDLCPEGEEEPVYAELLLRYQVRLLGDGQRVDFVFCDDSRKDPVPILAVEIDDPSHWRDAAKASNDRRRDRFLLLSNQRLPTMRFSNHEVAAHPDRFAKEAITYTWREVITRDWASQRDFSLGYDAGKRSEHRDDAEEKPLQ